MIDLNNYLTRYSKYLMISVLFVLSVLVGIVRLLTGPEWELTLFYIFPIYIATWYIGKSAGIFISIISAMSWLLADFIMISSFSNALVPSLNQTFRLIVFLIITLGLSKLKSSLDRQRELAMTDSLTGIANRRSFLKSANMEILRSNRLKRPFSVAYMDIDDFKNVNDTLGHSKGDALLYSVANTLSSNTRAIDVVARLGGDEFIILLPETGSKSAREVALKLQANLMEIVKEGGWSVTFSFGVVTFKCPPKGIDEMIKEADTLMYSAKQDGKNMIKYKIKNNYNKGSVGVA
ncbi:MAG: GGDEF domain-containing protein [Spirochaetota bacterium]|nr:GGDEF domain-containing protein [Spirochaetota bacterium]